MSTTARPSAREDAMQIHRAFKGIGCDADVIVNILGHRDASQRDDIQQEYETIHSDDLQKRLSKELHGNLKKAVLLWMQHPTERDVATLRHALMGPIIDLKAASEILCSQTSSRIRQIKQAYAHTFSTRLEYDIDVQTCGYHKQLLLAYISTTRYEGPEIDRALIENDAKAIHRVGEKKFRMDEKTFTRIFSERSRAHLVALVSMYHKMYGVELKKAIKRETSGNFKYCLLTILECADNPAKYFTWVLRKAMKGLGTKDTTLIRIVVTRAELDLQIIKAEYQKKYNKTLCEAVHSETSGHYRAFLLALIGCSS